MASHHVETLAARALQQSIRLSFRGYVHINGTKLVTTHLSGTIGRDHFTGSGTGTVAGTTFQGGAVFLSNRKGNIEFSLGPAFVASAGQKSIIQQVSLVAVSASGKYAQDVGMTGTLTSWNLPARPTALASFSGTLST
jgi:hypothetical protein